MRFFKKIFIFSFNLPIYILSRIIIIRSKRIWVFGSRFGNKYFDSSKCFFEYVNRENKKIKVIWLTKSDDVYESLKYKGFKVYKTYSFLGYYYFMFSSLAVVACGTDNINKFVFIPKILNIWHGIPLKKIVYDDKYSNLSKNNFLIKIKNLTEKLEKEHIKLDVKKHHYHQSNKKNQRIGINFISDHDVSGDIYSILNEYDVLITDYSNIYINFLLSEKPIIHFAYDLSEYLSSDKEFYYDYEKVTAGPIVKDWSELYQCIIDAKEAVSSESFDKRKITGLREYFHIHNDGRSSERVFMHVIDWFKL